MSTMHDHAAVIAPPPLIYAGALATVFLMRWLWPVPLPALLEIRLVGALMVVVGLALGIPGRRSLGAAGTSVNPARPTTVIVQSSSYRLTRNPLYVGLAAVFLGISFLAGTPWGLVVLCPVAVVMHVGVILREERYLDRKFGDVYRRYCAEVRRYL